ncbi:actin cytoskeleton-regulatory complex protein PAN1-like [Trachemys scripta elegans]|uniref:actin cytoskeleton-regulatory complex protein PAN1-like n=1 Tax=Trachemys scripta elegans TaxID=31138 RepID=UPI0015566583|nr:actin cytoskeleton-regulatory complex protein PAN1-like [Trachemys scripta elegans]
MSWPGEAWQEGLPARALQGVRELEQRLEWANKERVQKQAQLDTLEAALHKQRQKHEEERGTWALLARERRDLAEACELLECGRQQLSRELQAKGAQLSQLEGQLGRATQRIEELEEELRRCQAELDNLRSSTPLSHCWAPQDEGVELNTWEQNPRLENRPRTPSMRLQPSSSTLGEEPLVHRGAAWHSVPPGGPAPPENSQGIPSPGEEPREENAGPGRGPPDVEAWELRGELQSVQQELAQCTEQRDQAVTKLSALERRVQQLLEELRGQRQRAGATQRRLEQQEREHRQELAKLERHHREALEQQVTRLDIPEPPHRPPNKQGLGGSEQQRRPPGCGRRSLSSSRLERAPEKRGAAGKVRGSSAQDSRAVGRLVPGGERGREPEPPTELQALRAEVLGLRRRLAASESLHRGLLETCWQLRQGARDLTGEHRALAEMPLAHDAAVQHKEEAQELRGALGPSLAKGERGELQALAVELEAQVWGAPGPGLPGGDAQEVGELQVLRGKLRALALGKAEAEAQAAQAQERLRRLQETLGLQTERLALACEAQSQHVAELLTEGHEREQELERLGQALREAGRVRELLEAEVGRLLVLLGGETPSTGPPEPPPTVPEPSLPEPSPTVPEPGSAEPPPTVPEPGLPEPSPTVPELGPAEPPPTVPEPPAEPPPTVPEPSPTEPHPTVPEALTTTPSELPPIAPESGPPSLASPTPAELPIPLELAVVSRMWEPAGKQAWHSEQAPLQNILWELQKPAGQAGLQEQLEEVLSRLLQENRALRAELVLWQSHAREECTTPATGDGQHQGTSATPRPAPLGDRGQGDLAYVLQTAWPGVRDAQTQTEGPARGRRHKELISAAFDHTQYEPYGLPEVVMKGFADIPSGPSCPYVLRRGLLGSTPLAQLAPKAEPEEDPTEPAMGTSV